MKKIKVLFVAGGDSLNGKLLNELKSKKSKFELYQASNKNEVTSKIKKHKDIRIMILDSDCEEAKFEIIEYVRKVNQKIKTIIYTNKTDTETISKALEKDADGYISKDTTMDEIITALLNIESGRKYFCDKVVEYIKENKIERLANYKKNPFEIIDIYTELSPKEKEAFEYLAKGMDVKELAIMLKTKVEKIEKHKATLLEKFGLSNQGELTKLAKSLGLVV